MRREVEINDGRDFIKLPLMVGGHYKTDISVAYSEYSGGGIIIYSSEYRDVKCGKGTRKVKGNSEMITIPISVMEDFSSAINELLEKIKQYHADSINSIQRIPRIHHP